MTATPADHVAVFYQGLLAEGRPQLQSSHAPLGAEIDLAADCLLEHARYARSSLAFSPPAPDRNAVRWGAAMVYRSAQFLAFRDLGAELIERDLQLKPPPANTPAVCYGVDLSFQFLPDLLRLTKALSQSDPLLEVLRKWSADWPLSSVGVAGVSPGPIDGFIDDPALRMLYIDRIIRTKDLGRLNDPRVARAAAAALGAIPELASEVAAAIHAQHTLSGST